MGDMNHDEENCLSSPSLEHGQVHNHLHSGWEVILSPRNTWEKVHKYMVHLAEQKKDKERSPTEAKSPINASSTRLKESNCAETLSTTYNDDCQNNGFDYVIVLKSKEVYAFWASRLDFSAENGLDENVKNDKNQENSLLMTKVKKWSRVNPIDSKPFQTNSINVSVDESDAHISPMRLINNTDNMSIDRKKRKVFTHRQSLFYRAISVMTPPKRDLKNITIERGGNNICKQQRKKKKVSLNYYSQHLLKSLGTYLNNNNQSHLHVDHINTHHLIMLII